LNLNLVPPGSPFPRFAKDSREVAIELDCRYAALAWASPLAAIWESPHKAIERNREAHCRLRRAKVGEQVVVAPAAADLRTPRANIHFESQPGVIFEPPGVTKVNVEMLRETAG